jgi:hypothetical protein
MSEGKDESAVLPAANQRVSCTMVTRPGDESGSDAILAGNSGTRVITLMQESLQW